MSDATIYWYAIEKVEGSPYNRTQFIKVKSSTKEGLTAGIKQVLREYPPEGYMTRLVNSNGETEALIERWYTCD